MADIFISSTYIDLKEHRERVSSVIRKMGYTDIAMEYYGAEDKRPLDKCLEDVVTCDLYIGIFAWRYGFIPPGHQKSITELEYSKARELGKPCLIFLLKEDVPWSPVFIDENRAKISAFREELCTNYVVDFFTSIDSLSACVTEAIHKWDRDKSVSSITPRQDLKLNVEAYYNAIFRKYKILDLDALTPPERADIIEIQLQSVFVEQDVRESPPPIEIPKGLLEKLIKDEKLSEEDLPEGIKLEDIKKAKEAYLEKPALPVLDVITNPKNRHVVILGDPGSGKSTLSRYLILSIITKEDEKLKKAFDNYLPLLIELRDYAAECEKDKCDTFLEYLNLLGKTKGYGLTKKALDKYLRIIGKAVVIFDGLDEIFDPEQRDSIEQQIVGFSISYPKIQIIVTSRIVGYKKRNFKNAGFFHYTLQDLSKSQMNAFIDKWYGIALINSLDEANARKERINRALEDSTSIKQLAGNPLLLTIMAIINKHQELPRERWRLYDFASNVLIFHWDWERKIREWNIKIEYVDKTDKEELLRWIAYKMQSAPKGLAGNYIHADTLQAEFERYFIERYQKNPADAKLAAHALIEQLRERNFILCRYGSNLYGFIHRTFLEYFCAWSIVWKFNIKHEFNIEGLKGVFEEHWGDEYWHEVLRLICGMIDEKFAETLINYLMQPPPSSSDELRKLEIKFPKIFSRILGNDGMDPGQQRIILNSTWERERCNLAIKCMGELKNIELIRDTSSKLLEKTWEVVVDDGYFNEDLINSIKSIGKRWAGRERIKDLILKYRTEYKNQAFEIHWWYERRANVIGEIIGSIGEGDKNIRNSVILLLKKEDPLLKNIGLTALVFGWYDDPDTLKLIQKYALEDSSEAVRKTLVSIIGQKVWRADSEMLSILRSCALTDKSYSVRKSAIQVISDGWSDNPEIFPFLCNLAKSASEFNIRIIALQQIGKIWKKDIKALELLKDRAINDTYSGVREIALSFLEENWREEPTVLDLLREHISKERNPVIRGIIYKILAAKDA